MRMQGEEDGAGHSAGLSMPPALLAADRLFLARKAGRRPERRMALAMTATDEPDMAMAAISGVTWPRMATGTAIAL